MKASVTSTAKYDREPSHFMSLVHAAAGKGQDGHRTLSLTHVSLNTSCVPVLMPLPLAARSCLMQCL